jgi:TPR repeat protein
MTVQTLRQWVLLCAVVVATPMCFAQYGAMSPQELTQKAEAGDPEAQFRLGAAYDSGRGVARDGAEAEKWYRRAAEAGHAEAQNSIGSGLQAQKRYEEARIWYERAAAQRHPLAITSLGYLHDLGLGTKQDRRKGFELYSQASDLGWAEAMWNLANMYGAGQLGEKDLNMACVWTFRALKYVEPSWEQRLAPASRAASFFQRGFSSEQLAACKKTAEDWRPSATAPKQDAQQGAAGDAPSAARP